MRQEIKEADPMGRMILWLALIVILVAIPLSLGVTQRHAIRPSAEPNWQLSMTPEIQLGVRDKYGALGTYTAVFVVNGPNGSTYRAQQQPNDLGWCFVYFPMSFQAFGAPGNYLWHAEVNGNIVVQGQFRMTNNSVTAAGY
jgi:hypothetical protein